MKDEKQNKYEKMFEMADKANKAIEQFGVENLKSAQRAAKSAQSLLTGVPEGSLQRISKLISDMRIESNIDPKSLGDYENIKREAQAKAIATEMKIVITGVLEKQNEIGKKTFLQSALLQVTIGILTAIVCVLGSIYSQEIKNFFNAFPWYDTNSQQQTPQNNAEIVQPCQAIALPNNVDNSATKNAKDQSFDTSPKEHK